MGIPPAFSNRSVYHITHLDNLASILEFGLLSTNERNRLGLERHTIAYGGIQDRRAAMEVPREPGGSVHDYVPLYFCVRSPMLLAVVQNKIADEQFIIYLDLSISVLEQYPSVFTDASANTSIAPNFYQDPNDLARVDWDAVNTFKWGKQYDSPGMTPVKQAKMAELLVQKRIDPGNIRRIVVFNKSFKNKVLEIYDAKGLAAPPVEVGDYHYYYYGDGRLSPSNRPPVTGPYFIYKAYRETVKNVLESLGNAGSPRFESLEQLLTSLETDMKSLPETAELVDLETDNRVHSKDVGTHTLNVVAEVRELIKDEEMAESEKILVVLSAFLHDIGKGPKKRWEKYDGRQQLDPDHPIHALPMLHRILTQETAMVGPSEATLICKLVCYHDLVGDILAKGRRIEELMKIIRSKEELNMLIALGMADMRAVNSDWYDLYIGDVGELREQVLANLNSGSAAH